MAGLIKKRLILSGVLLIVLPGTISSQNAQEPQPQPQTVEQPQYRTALALVRAINTAEVVDLSTYGSFSSWEVLVSHHQQYFDDFAAMNVHHQQIPNSKFGEPPEVLPGWNLRLNLHSDGQGYDLMLQDMTEKKCPFAFFSNEQALIWESKVMGCAPN